MYLVAKKNIYDIKTNELIFTKDKEYYINNVNNEYIELNELNLLLPFDFVIKNFNIG